MFGQVTLVGIRIYRPPNNWTHKGIFTHQSHEQQQHQQKQQKSLCFVNRGSRAISSNSSVSFLPLSFRKDSNWVLEDCRVESKSYNITLQNSRVAHTSRDTRVDGTTRMSQLTVLLCVISKNSLVKFSSYSRLFFLADLWWKVQNLWKLLFYVLNDSSVFNSVVLF